MNGTASPKTVSHAAADRDGRRQLRQDVLRQLAKLNTAQIEHVAVILLREMPETELLLTYADPTALEAPESADEEVLWPLILRRQSMIAMSGDPRTAQPAMMFFARLYGKIEPTGGPRAKTPTDKDQEPGARLASMQREIRSLAEQFASHEPGEATIVPTLDRKPG